MPVADSDNLIGLGLPAQLANVIGAKANALTCASTSAAAAAVLKSRNSELITAGGATACVPPSNAPIMEPYFLFTSTSTTAVVCVPSGHTLNGSLNGTLNLAQNKACILYQYKKTFWATILTA